MSPVENSKQTKNFNFTSNQKKNEKKSNKM